MSVATTNTTITIPLILSCKTSTMLANVFLGCCFINLGLTLAFLDQIRMFAYQNALPRANICVVIKPIQESFKEPHLQLAVPLTVFIGLEHCFMFAKPPTWRGGSFFIQGFHPLDQLLSPQLRAWSTLIFCQGLLPVSYTHLVQRVSDKYSVK